ncbi:MAG: hypothetical protein AB8H47_29300 [Bacteroidia bacterium]
MHTLLIHTRNTMMGLSLAFLLTAGTMETSSPIHTLLRDLVKADSISWQLVEQYDPYHGGHTQRTSQKTRPELTLKALGGFKELSADPVREGEWIVDINEKTIHFVYTRIDGRLVNKPIEGPTYTVKSYDEALLVLTQQGRHGMVELRYQALAQGQ